MLNLRLTSKLWKTYISSDLTKLFCDLLGLPRWVAFDRASNKDGPLEAYRD